MNIKKYTKLWYGDEVKNSITGRQGIIAKFMGFGDGLSLLLKVTEQHRMIAMSLNGNWSRKPTRMITASLLCT